MLKFKKYTVRRFVHFVCFALQSTSTVKYFFTVTLNGEKSPGRAKDICLYQGCQLPGFSPEKANMGILFEKCF
jgi:hypothetical protein